MELGKLGTRTNRRGDSAYRGEQNPLLIQGVLTNHDIPMNPSTFGRIEPAVVLASLVGGEVVTDPRYTYLQVKQPEGVQVWAIQIGEEYPVNAGALLTIMGNDIQSPNARSKSIDMGRLLGIPDDPTLADKFWDALELGSGADVSVAAVGMNFWQQFAILTASSALKGVIRMYAQQYFTPEELAASDVVVDALADLPNRVKSGV